MAAKDAQGTLSKARIGKLKRLFGVDTDRARVAIFLSRLEILPGGTIAVGSEDLTLGYSGPAINYVEYEGARALADVLKKEGVAPDVPIEVSPLYHDANKFKADDLPIKNRLRDKMDLLIDTLGEEPDYDLWEVLKLDTRSKIMPELRLEKDENLILLGNQTYNLYALHYRTAFQFDFAKRQPGAGGRSYRGLYCVPREEGKWPEIVARGKGNLPREPFEIPCRGLPKRDQYFEVGVIDRLVDAERGGRIIIVCAGTGVRATKACALWLARHCGDLAEEPDWNLPGLRPEDTQTFPLFVRVRFNLNRDGPGFDNNPDDPRIEDDDIEIISLRYLRERAEYRDGIYPQH